MVIFIVPGGLSQGRDGGEFRMCWRPGVWGRGRVRASRTRPERTVDGAVSSLSQPPVPSPVNGAVNSFHLGSQEATCAKKAPGQQGPRGHSSLECPHWEAGTPTLPPKLGGYNHILPGHKLHRPQRLASSFWTLQGQAVACPQALWLGPSSLPVPSLWVPAWMWTWGTGKGGTSVQVSFSWRRAV